MFRRGHADNPKDHCMKPEVLNCRRCYSHLHRQYYRHHIPHQDQPYRLRTQGRHTESKPPLYNAHHNSNSRLPYSLPNSFRQNTDSRFRIRQRNVRPGITRYSKPNHTHPLGRVEDRNQHMCPDNHRRLYRMNLHIHWPNNSHIQVERFHRLRNNRLDTPRANRLFDKPPHDHRRLRTWRNNHYY